MPFRAHYDAGTGKVRGFFDLAEFPLERIPSPSILLTDEQHKAMLASGSPQIDARTLAPVLEVPKAVKLGRVKAARKDEVDDRLADVLARGMTIDDFQIQCRPHDLVNICGAVNYADYVLADNAKWPANFGWRTRNDVKMPVPGPADMKALGAQVFAFVSAKREVCWAKKAAIDALKSADEVAAYDIDSGW